MEWERKAIKAQASRFLVHFQLLAVMATPRTGQATEARAALDKMFHQIEILIKIVLRCLFHDVQMIMIDDTQHCTALEI